MTRKRTKDKPLKRAFYDRDVVDVARELLGKHLVREDEVGRTSGRIVEVEAYLAADDPACHASRGKTKKNASMFGPPGHAYVYPIHAKWCLNAVTQPTGVASAVLIRGVEPLDGWEIMAKRRGKEDPREFARGPAKLCQAMAIEKPLDGWDLTLGEQLWIADNDPCPIDESEIVASKRIGVTSGEELLLSFSIADCRFVSGPRRRKM